MGSNPGINRHHCKTANTAIVPDIRKCCCRHSTFTYLLTMSIIDFFFHPDAPLFPASGTGQLQANLPVVRLRLLPGKPI